MHDTAITHQHIGWWELLSRTQHYLTQSFLPNLDIAPGISRWLQEESFPPNLQELSWFS
jgi:hypothetical protein